MIFLKSWLQNLSTYRLDKCNQEKRPPAACGCQKSPLYWHGSCANVNQSSCHTLKLFQPTIILLRTCVQFLPLMVGFRVLPCHYTGYKYQSPSDSASAVLPRNTIPTPMRNMHLLFIALVSSVTLASTPAPHCSRRRERGCVCMHKNEWDTQSQKHREIETTEDKDRRGLDQCDGLTGDVQKGQIQRAGSLSAEVTNEDTRSAPGLMLENWSRVGSAESWHLAEQGKSKDLQTFLKRCITSVFCNLLTFRLR